MTSLRDQFAMHAVSSLIASSSPPHTQGELAVTAYRIADACLEARGRPLVNPHEWLRIAEIDRAKLMHDHLYWVMIRGERHPRLVTWSFTYMCFVGCERGDGHHQPRDIDCIAEFNEPLPP